MDGAATTERDLRELEAFLARYPGCRMLYVTGGASRRFALDVALMDAHIAAIKAPNFVNLVLSDIEDFDRVLEQLAGDPPDVAVTYYARFQDTDGPPRGERDSEVFRVRDRFLKLEALHAWLNRRGIPIVMECGDMHSRVGVDHFYEQIRQYSVSGLITNNRASIEIVQEELAARQIRCVRAIWWQPLGIDPSVHRDYGLEKQYGFLMYGRTDEAFRKQILDYCRVRQIVTFGRFGFKRWQRNTIDGGTLFQEVNRARAAFAAHQTGGVYQGRPLGMTYAKYFEIPGCRTLLVGQPTPDLPHLGFVEGEHYVSVMPATYRKTIRLLAKELKSERVRAITDRAHTLVHERHRTAQHLNEAIRDVITAHAARPVPEPSPAPATGRA